jgi:hypothetical protein
VIDLAIVGIGRWGRVLVDSVQDKSPKVRFTKGVTRTPAKAAEYCAAKGIELAGSLEEVLADPAIDGWRRRTPSTPPRSPRLRPLASMCSARSRSP